MKCRALIASHAWKAVASDLNEGLMCIGLHFLPSAQWSSNHQPNPKPEKPHPLPSGKVTGQESFMQDTSRSSLFPLNYHLFRLKQVLFGVFVFASCRQENWAENIKLAGHGWWIIKMKMFGVPPTFECSVSFASLLHWPVTKTNETECRRVRRTMQARVHLSPYVNRAGRGEAFSRPHSGQLKESAPPDMS